VRLNFIGGDVMKRNILRCRARDAASMRTLYPDARSFLWDAILDVCQALRRSIRSQNAAAKADMTSTLIAKLVDRRVLSWDTPLSSMLPDLTPIMRPEYRSVTLVQLLSHQSGLPRDLQPALDAKEIFLDQRSLPEQRLAYIAPALRMAPAFSPGSSVQYCNTGFILAGVIAERTTGVPFEKLMRQEIFEPLGMSSALFGSPPEEAAFVGHQDGRPAKYTEGAHPRCITLQVLCV
jgi:CubicO group peptidase (beta-lactamase class C family)